MVSKTHCFKSVLWLYPGENANWHFLTLPKPIGQEIKKNFGAAARGFGSLPVEVEIGKTIWQTSIFPDKYSGSYLLPIKASVRKTEDLYVDETVSCTLRIRK